MNILVTGGAGYIGSHVANQLCFLYPRVYVFDNLSTGFKDSLNSKIHFIQGDLRSSEQIQATLQQNQIDTVFHFAAKLSPKESVFDPLSYYETNVLGTLHLLRACQKNNVKNFIFASSSNVYGESSTDLHEQSPTRPINPYGQTKKICEQMIHEYSLQSQLRYKILRYFNVAGASDNLQNGQKTKNAYHLIHLASQAAISHTKKISIYGTNYKTADGTCIRDYIHIDDLVDLHILCLKDLIDNKNNEILNCGYGQGYSVKEIINTMLALAPQKFQVLLAERREGDAATLVANTNYLLKKFYDWKPKRNNLKLICQSALDWELKQRIL